MVKIGNVEIPNRSVLAPMAAINCTAFRLLCKKNGSGLIYTQMVDSNFICEKTKEEAKQFINVLNIERPLSIQLIGSDPEKMAKAAKLIEDFADIIDINMGCHLPNKIDCGAGAALLKDLNLIEKVVKSVIEATSKPVTAKIRIGWDNQSLNAVKVAKLLDSCKVSAIAVHGRTFEQRYGGKANRLILKQVKNAVSVPVIANGDISSIEEGEEVLEKTGCDLFMIGREAKHSPWVFDKKFIKNNENIKKQIFEFIELYEKHENRMHVNEIREHAYWMLRDFKTKENTRKLFKIESLKEIKTFLKNLR